jgi:surfactin synthase thioesterase subunit
LRRLWHHVRLVSRQIAALRGYIRLCRDKGLSVEKQNGWAEHTSKGFDKHQFSGGHFFIKENHSEILSIVASVLGTERHRPSRVELNVETPAPTTPGPRPPRP